MNLDNINDKEKSNDIMKKVNNQCFQAREAKMFPFIKLISFIVCFIPMTYQQITLNVIVYYHFHLSFLNFFSSLTKH